MKGKHRRRIEATIQTLY